MDYQYTLIVSQYYHSRHTFIVGHDERFLERAKAFVTELSVYKRNEDDTRPINFGDLSYIHEVLQSPEIRIRYKINDSGDIYFRQSTSIEHCENMAVEYHETSIYESKEFKTKKITNEILKHHDYDRVREIVEKHFEIA